MHSYWLGNSQSLELVGQMLNMVLREKLRSGESDDISGRFVVAPRASCIELTTLPQAWEISL
jgi:hypothetical protein